MIDLSNLRGRSRRIILRRFSFLPLIVCLSSCNMPNTRVDESVAPVEEKNSMVQELDKKDEIVQVSVKADEDEYAAFLKAAERSDKYLMLEKAAQILEKRPDDPKVLNGLAYFHRKKKQFGMSRILTDRVLQKNPNDAQARVNSAFLYIQEKEEGLALKEFLRAAATSDGNLSINRNIASLYLKFGLYSSAESFLERAYQNADKASDFDLAANYAATLHINGKYTRALPIYRAEMKDKNLAVFSQSTKGKELTLNYLALLKEQPQLVNEEKDTVTKLSSLSGPRIMALAKEVLALAQQQGVAP